MKPLLWALAITVVSALPATAQPAQRAQRSPFPHQEHAGLFPLCESCHAGIATGNAAASYPPEASCRECHNGTDERPVEWRRPVRATGLLRFSHPEHATKVDSAGRQCGTCHGTAGAPRMAVHRANPESCLTCHAHRATAHLAEDNRCATCHVPLTSAPALTRERIAAFSKPPSHERANFTVNHAPATQQGALTCAICHARQSCTRCHLNAATQPIIAALQPDDRVAALVAGKEAVYVAPADHHGDDFAWGHGALARASTMRCATCHTRQSCTACHTGTAGADILRQMPNAEPGAPGVRLQHRRTREPRGTLLASADTIRRQPAKTVAVHDEDFRIAHRMQAAASALDCAGCHTQRFCSDCHAGETGSTRRFHSANFTVNHASTAYGRETDCAACHNTQAFCRGCHVQSGLGSRGRLDVAYHTAQPQWLLQHGRAARQGLENCSSCHVQRDCLTCHSTVGWGINPHGRDFDAARQAKKAPVMCLSCHLSVPGRDD